MTFCFASVLFTHCKSWVLRGRPSAKILDLFPNEFKVFPECFCTLEGHKNIEKKLLKFDASESKHSYSLSDDLRRTMCSDVVTHPRNGVSKRRGITPHAVAVEAPKQVRRQSEKWKMNLTYTCVPFLMQICSPASSKMTERQIRMKTGLSRVLKLKLRWYSINFDSSIRQNLWLEYSTGLSLTTGISLDWSTNNLCEGHTHGCLSPQFYECSVHKFHPIFITDFQSDCCAVLRFGYHSHSHGGRSGEYPTEKANLPHQTN